MPSSEPICQLLDRWRAGDQDAAHAIYQRYEKRLIALVAMQCDSNVRTRVDPDDIMLSVLRTSLRRVSEGQYTVDPSGTLWHLLQKIAKHKILKYIEFHRAQKRDVLKEERQSAEQHLRHLAAKAPTPGECAALADELHFIRQQLTPRDFEIFELRLEGCSYREIALSLGCPHQTVRYRLNRVQQWLSARYAATQLPNEE